MPDSPALSPPGSPPALLATLAHLASQSFTSEETLVAAILNAIADQIQVRTPFLSSTQAGKFELLDMVNRQGCTVKAGIVLPLSQSYCSTTVSAGRPLSVDDARHDPIFSQLAITRSANVGSYIGVPIRFADGEIVGTLCGVDPDPHTFTAAQLDFLEVLGHYMGAFLERNVGLRAQSALPPRPAAPESAATPPAPDARPAAAEGAPNVAPSATPAKDGQARVLLLDSTGAKLHPVVATLGADFAVQEVREPAAFDRVEAEIAAVQPAVLALVSADPPETSLELVTQVRRAHPDLPVLFLTSQRYHFVKGYFAGATRCILSSSPPEATAAALHELAAAPPQS